ncbi:MAG TPA: hypothetical protein VKS81_02175 [Bacteroidota bacterium]|nr:hypothetical protein [Bacteroidota bacterium]
MKRVTTILLFTSIALIFFNQTVFGQKSDPGHSPIAFRSSSDFYAALYADTLTLSRADTNHFGGIFQSPFSSPLAITEEDTGVSRNALSTSPNYYIAGTAIATGAISAYFKLNADHYFSEYKQNPSPTLLHKIHTYDTFAGISLALSQIGVLTFTYLLFTK